MKKHILLPLLALAAGGAGFYLNYQLQTVSIDPLTQLLVSGTPYPTLLMGLTLGFATLMFLLLCDGVGPVGLKNAYDHPPLLTVALWMAGGFLLLAGGGAVVLEFLTIQEQRSLGLAVSLPIVPMIAAVLSLPACVGLLVLSKHLNRDSHPDTLPLMTLFPAFSALPWLLYCYYDNTSNPTIILYGYQLIGLACATVGLYLVSSLAYLPQNGRPKTAIFFSLMGSYLLITSLSLGQAFYTAASHQALVLILLANAIVMLKNVQSTSPSLEDEVTLDSQEGNI